MLAIWLFKQLLTACFPYSEAAAQLWLSRFLGSLFWEGRAFFQDERGRCGQHQLGLFPLASNVDTMASKWITACLTLGGLRNMGICLCLWSSRWAHLQVIQKRCSSAHTEQQLSPGRNHGVKTRQPWFISGWSEESLCLKTNSTRGACSALSFLIKHALPGPLDSYDCSSARHNLGGLGGSLPPPFSVKEKELEPHSCFSRRNVKIKKWASTHPQGQ